MNTTTYKEIEDLSNMLDSAQEDLDVLENFPTLESDDVTGAVLKFKEIVMARHGIDGDPVKVTMEGILKTLKDSALKAIYFLYNKIREFITRQLNNGRKVAKAIKVLYDRATDTVDISLSGFQFFMGSDGDTIIKTGTVKDLAVMLTELNELTLYSNDIYAKIVKDVNDSDAIGADLVKELSSLVGNGSKDITKTDRDAFLKKVDYIFDELPDIKSLVKNNDYLKNGLSIILDEKDNTGDAAALSMYIMHGFTDSTFTKKGITGITNEYKALQKTTGKLKPHKLNEAMIKPYGKLAKTIEKLGPSSNAEHAINYLQKIVTRQHKTYSPLSKLLARVLGFSDRYLKSLYKDIRDTSD